MLNYVVIHESALAEVLIAKLTCFYNKVILQQPTRLIVLLSSHVELHRAELHKAMFDEIIVTKFDPSDVQFWKTKNLYKFLYFVHTGYNEDCTNIYIDHGKIFQHFEVTVDMDVLVAQGKDDSDLIRHVNEQLSTHCDLPKLPDEELVFYDFSLFAVSDHIRAHFQKLVKQILSAYPEHVDVLCSYAIMSCVLAHAKKQTPFQVSLIEQNPIDIADSRLVEDFYTLI